MRRAIWVLLALTAVAGGCRTAPSSDETAEVDRLLRLLDSPEEDTRLRAAAALVSMEGPEARKAVKRRLDRRNEPEVRAALALALEIRPRREYLAQLIAMLSDEEETVAQAAAKALSAYDFDLVEQPLLDIAADRGAPERTRRYAIGILGRTGRPEVVASLVNLLDEKGILPDVVAALKRITRQDLDEPQQWRYWWDANRERTQAQWYADKIDELKQRIALMDKQLKAQEVLVKQLADRLADGEIEKLKERPNKEAPVPLIAALDHAIPKVRRYAAEELAKLKAAAAVDKLCEVVVNDRDPGVRAAAARALGEIDDRKAEIALGKALESPDETVAVAAASALGRLKSENAVTGLMVALLREDAPALRAAAATALGQIGKPDAVTPLMELLQKDPEEAVRAAAAEALGQIGDERAYPVLEEALKDKGAEVRYFAVKGLGAFKKPGTSTLLSSLLEKETNDSVREIIVVTLGNVGDEKAIDTLAAVLLDSRPNLQKLRDRALSSIQRIVDRLRDLTEPTADRLRQAGRPEDAVKLYEQRIKQLTESGEQAKIPPVRRKLADTYLALKQPANALPALRELVKVFTDDLKLAKTYAETLTEVKSYPEAFAAYGALASKDKKENYFEERLWLLDAMIAEERYVDAARLAGEVLAGEPPLPETVRQQFETRRKQAADAVEAARRKRQQEVRGWIAELIDPDEAVRQAARAKLTTGKEEALPLLVETLSSTDAKQRQAAVELLRELAGGVNFGYKPAAEPADNAEAIDNWKKWLKDRTPR